MIAIEYINDSIPTLNPNSTVSKTLELMEEFRVRQLPVLNQSKINFLGLIDEDFLLDIPNPEHAILENILLEHKNIHVFSNSHLYTILSVFGENKIDVVPVLNEKLEYLGTITSNDLQNKIETIFATQESGAVIIITTSAIQYSMQELSRLIESNNAKILSSFVERDQEDITKLHITFKLDITDVSHVIATLERFGYHIKGRFDNALQKDYEQERLDLLMKYLEI